jgi:hypothetical protein
MCTVYSKEHINPANKNKFHIIAIGYSSTALPRPAPRGLPAISQPYLYLWYTGSAGKHSSASIVVFSKGFASLHKELNANWY